MDQLTASIAQVRLIQTVTLLPQYYFSMYITVLNPIPQLFFPLNDRSVNNYFFQKGFQSIIKKQKTSTPKLTLVARVHSTMQQTNFFWQSK